MLTKLARVGIGVGSAGRRRPDRPHAGGNQAVAANAKAIAYTGNGASRLRSTDDRAARRRERDAAKVAPHRAGAAPASVAKGESDLVLTLISESCRSARRARWAAPSDFRRTSRSSAAPSAKARAMPPPRR